MRVFFEMVDKWCNPPWGQYNFSKNMANYNINESNK